MSGPVRAARLQFRAKWDQQLPAAGDSVRTVYVLHPVLGPIVFYGMLVGPRQVEIAGFEYDADYWHRIAGDPED
jgi:hypothetical protein